MNEARTAWFHHFWPWFIVGLLGVSVVGSLCTVVIAYRYGDVEVVRTPASSKPNSITTPPRVAPADSPRGSAPSPTETR